MTLRALLNMVYLGHVFRYAREMSCSAVDLDDTSSQIVLVEEARVISRLNHRNLVRFEELIWSEDRTVFYLVSEYISGESLAARFHSMRQLSSTNGGEGKPGFSDTFVRRCIQAVLDALEHMHVELGIAHTNIKMDTILFDPAGCVKVGVPLPLSTYRAMDVERQKQVSMTNGQQLELAKANDIQDAGAMMLELCTGQTLQEHGGIQNAMSVATGLSKDDLVYHAQGMVKEVAVNRISAGQAAWRMAQCVEDLKMRDARFQSWRRTLIDNKVLRQQYAGKPKSVARYDRAV